MSLSTEDSEHYGKASVLVGYDFQSRTYATPPTPAESRASFEEAKTEFDKISHEVKQQPFGLKLAIDIYRGVENWAKMTTTAAELASLFPGEPRWIVEWAYGARRSISIEAARDILAKGEKLHPTNADIQLYLATHEGQLGNVEKGRQHLFQATATDSAAMSGKAISDPDIGPLLEGLSPVEMLTILHLPITSKGSDD